MVNEVVGSWELEMVNKGIGRRKIGNSNLWLVNEYTEMSVCPEALGAEDLPG